MRWRVWHTKTVDSLAVRHTGQWKRMATYHPQTMLPLHGKVRPKNTFQIDRMLCAIMTSTKMRMTPPISSDHLNRCPLTA